MKKLNYYKAIYKTMNIYKNKNISYRIFKKSIIKDFNKYKYFDTDNVTLLLGTRSSGKKYVLESLGYKVITYKVYLNRIYGKNNG